MSGRSKVRFFLELFFLSSPMAYWTPADLEGLIWCHVFFAFSNQSVLKEINPEYLLEGLVLKLKLQYFGHYL